MAKADNAQDAPVLQLSNEVGVGSILRNLPQLPTVNFQTPKVRTALASFWTAERLTGLTAGLLELLMLTVRLALESTLNSPGRVH